MKNPNEIKSRNYNLEDYCNFFLYLDALLNGLIGYLRAL